MGFKDEVKKINSKFYVKEFDGQKEEKKHSSGILYYAETHHIQVWDIDNRGEHYCVMDIKDRTPGRGDVAWLKEADRIRREGSQVKNLKKSNDKNLKIEESINQRNYNENIERAKEVRSAAVAIADDLGATYHKPTVLDKDWNNKFYSSGI